MNKFKSGDKTVFIKALERGSASGANYMANQILTIVDTKEELGWTTLYKVDEGDCRVFEQEIELLSVYDSPLFKALRELD